MNVKEHILAAPDNIFDAVMGKKIGTVVSDK